MAEKRILVFADWFSPGYKAGGPITSVVNFVEQLKDRFDLFVFTSDRDLGDVEAYPGIEADQWISRSNYSVFYASPGQRGRQLVWRIIEEVKPDVIYLNSMYSLDFTVFPLLYKRISGNGCRMILSPRGMLRSSALAIKPLKKQIFLAVCRATGISRYVEFLATDQQETEDISAIFGKGVTVETLGNLPGLQPAFVPPPLKRTGSVRLIFVGRIHPIKNLLFLLESIKLCSSFVELSIVGPIEDAHYWKKCRELVDTMQGKLTVTNYQSVEKSRITPLLQEHHAFALPTTGENFGHAIFESLGAGRPVLISDQTPWLGLADKKAGWDLPIQSVETFSTAIDRLGAMNQDELEEWCNGAWNFCKQFMQGSNLREKYIEFFERS